MENAIGYKVTVTAVVERVERAGREWKPVSSEPGAKNDYTPEIDKTVQREVQVLEQRVDSLDMRALVAVINGLPLPQKAEP